MSYSVGDIVEGQVIAIKNYGLFIKNDDVSMFCHISKISNKFVNIFNDFKIGDIVKVKVIQIQDDKINVSIKDAIINDKTNTSSFEDLLKQYLNTSEDKLNDVNKRIKKRYK